MTEPAYGTTLVRAARPEPELVEITALGDPAPTYLEIWRGWRIEAWCDWEWEE